jgi:predicted nucleic acid-binding protein
MILVDTSVWINFFGGKRTPSTDALIKAIEESADLCICGLIMTEILQGIRSDSEFEKTKEILSKLLFLPITKEMFVKAASLYRTIRKKGQTIRSPIDCIIAEVCLEHEIHLLHEDKDFTIIARHSPLQIVK